MISTVRTSGGAAPSGLAVRPRFGRFGRCLLVALAYGAAATADLAGLSAAEPTARPSHAVLEACLSNWDHDAEPDGWQAVVVLLDGHVRTAPQRAHATFELIPRAVSLDRTHYVDLPVQPLRWWKPLHFDDAGMAVVRLPLPAGVTLGSRGRSPLAAASGALLRVRVSVPTVGVLESIVAVSVAEPLLVDSRWLDR